MAKADPIEALKRECRDQELEVVERAAGHFQVIGGKRVVSWWPLSKKRTAHADGARSSIKYANELTVIKLATAETLEGLCQ